jgi:phosphatidylinositol alpha 1,6-mannosyltransferase
LNLNAPTGPSMPAVAFFADSFHEVNGVALTSRKLESYAARHGRRFLSVHTGPETRCWDAGSVRRVELGLGRGSLRLEADLRFDLLCMRHRELLLGELERFQPDLIHVTGPSHLGLLGLWASRRLGVPLVASWHTNVHEYCGRRLRQMLSWMPAKLAAVAGRCSTSAALAATLHFYRRAERTLAPNPELTELLERATGRPSALMKRGVDTELFHPSKRRRADAVVRIGFAGRLSPEKGVRWLASVEDALDRAAFTNYEIWIAGHGNEEPWLRAHLRRKRIPGVLKGGNLADFYSNLDLFAFPSETDTYGNAIQEAMASGVPCVVTAAGGPKYLVRPGVDALLAATEAAFAQACVRLALDQELRARMAVSAREAAQKATWEKVFDGVYAVYASCLSSAASQVA